MKLLLQFTHWVILKLLHLHNCLAPEVGIFQQELEQVSLLWHFCLSFPLSSLSTRESHHFSVIEVTPRANIQRDTRKSCMLFANIVRNNSVISTTFFSSGLPQSMAHFQGEGILTPLFVGERISEFINTWASKVSK